MSWLEHVAAYRRTHPGLSYKDALKAASPCFARRGEKKGKGLWDSIKNVVNGAANLASDSRVNTLLPGEMHGLIQLPDRPNHYARAQYMGPGTSLKTRVLRGDPGLTAVDKSSKRHDIAYSLSTSQAQINAADDHMLRAIERNSDSQFNKNQARLIALKRSGAMLGFNVGSTYGDPQLDKDPALRARYQSELNSLTTQGFGCRRGRLSGRSGPLAPAGRLSGRSGPPRPCGPALPPWQRRI